MKYITTAILLFIVFLCQGCKSRVSSYEDTNTSAVIYPQYEGTYIPPNIAPLNFQIREPGDKFIVRFVAGKDSFETATNKNLNISAKKWKRLLQDNAGGELLVKIFAGQDEGWQKFNDIVFNIAPEPIDPYVAYRLIEPGYESWGKMGLYQRCVENFEETPILINSLTDNNCMNCHTFRNNDPNDLVFHLRGTNAGTIVARGEDVKKVNTKAPWMIAAGVYPRWHPAGRYIAFSTNNTSQGFLTAHTNKIEVFDMASDIVLYDTRDNRIFTSNLIHDPGSFETFPEWSPDGKYLYFCSAAAMDMPQNYQSLKYDLLRIGFNPENGTFTNKIDTLVSSRHTGKSVSMGRISPDGRYLIFCQADYGTFPIWHRENDLYLLDLETGKVSNMQEVNSSESDSYHSWSSNGRWLVFSSRRMDGSYTRLYISYFDKEGKGHAAFVLPQKSPEYYDYLLKSYNVPECIKGKVEISPYEFSEVARSEAVIPISNK